MYFPKCEGKNIPEFIPRIWKRPKVCPVIQKWHVPKAAYRHHYEGSGQVVEIIHFWGSGSCLSSFYFVLKLVALCEGSGWDVLSCIVNDN